VTPDQLAIVRALNGCSLQLGSGNKSFIRNMDALSAHDPARALTPHQEKWLYDLCHLYRRQLAPATCKRAAELLAGLPAIEEKSPRKKGGGSPAPTGETASFTLA
jgi:hypothetical protein